MVATCPGCLTASAWHRAAQDHMASPHILGTVQASDDVPWLARPAAVVVSYQLDGYGIEHDDVPVLIPLDADGRPAPPFAYAGDSRRPLGILDELDCNARKSIVETKLSDAACDKAWRAMSSDRFLRPYRAGAVREERVCPDDGVTLIAYVPSTTVRPPQLRSDDEPLGPAAHVLLLPTAPARPAGEHTRNVLVTAALTPAYVAVDAVAAPLLLLVILFGPRCC
jgi:hypothetical protein